MVVMEVMDVWGNGTNGIKTLSVFQLNFLMTLIRLTGANYPKIKFMVFSDAHNFNYKQRFQYLLFV